MLEKRYDLYNEQVSWLICLLKGVNFNGVKILKDDLKSSAVSQMVDE